MLFFRCLIGLIWFLLVEIVVFLPLYLLGLITFPFAWRLAGKNLVESRLVREQTCIAFRSALLNEWLGNHEDGLWPVWWQKRGGTPFGWFVRNPVCNMRFWPVVSTLPNPEALDWIGTLDHVPQPKEKGWFLAWQGAYMGFCWQGATRGLWVGYKVNPRDKTTQLRDYRWYGLGTALQIWKS